MSFLSLFYHSFITLLSLFYLKAKKERTQNKLILEYKYLPDLFLSKNKLIENFFRIDLIQIKQSGNFTQ